MTGHVCGGGGGGGKGQGRGEGGVCVCVWGDMVDYVDVILHYHHLKTTNNNRFSEIGIGPKCRVVPLGYCPFICSVL